MAFKKKLDANAETATALGGKNGQGKANPTSIEGYYLGAKSVETDYGPAKLHIFQDAETGTNTGVWGKTNMNRLLSPELVGQMCQVSFTGMGKAQKGRRPPYNYEVLHDEDNRIDTAGINLTAEASEEPDYDTTSHNTSGSQYDDESDSVDPEDDEKPVDELPPRRATPPRAAAVAPNAAAVARTQSLLNGRNKVS